MTTVIIIIMAITLNFIDSTEGTFDITVFP